MERLRAAVAHSQYINNGSQRAGGNLGRIDGWGLFLYSLLSGRFLLALLRRVSC